MDNGVVGHFDLPCGMLEFGMLDEASAFLELAEVQADRLRRLRGTPAHRERAARTAWRCLEDLSKYGLISSVPYDRVASVKAALLEQVPTVTESHRPTKTQ
jgi:hypothetical protein